MIKRCRIREFISCWWMSLV